jgi:hypothetical protein
MACYRSQAADGKMLNGSRATWGKIYHCGVVHYLPATFKALCLFKVLPIFFLGEISPKEDPISLKQHILSQILFFEKNCLKFWGRGGEGGFCKDFKLKKDSNSLDFDEKII